MHARELEIIGGGIGKVFQHKETGMIASLTWARRFHTCRVEHEGNRATFKFQIQPGRFASHHVVKIMTACQKAGLREAVLDYQDGEATFYQFRK